ncbi:MAG: hypothetical protein KatS3mg054_0056 [Chloroflexus sp.]|nr:MAG: hypothetical protein KatS3mg054_0056 [Chloroflexus sp.]
MINRQADPLIHDIGPILKAVCLCQDVDTKSIENGKQGSPMCLPQGRLANGGNVWSNVHMGRDLPFVFDCIGSTQKQTDGIEDI